MQQQLHCLYSDNIYVINESFRWRIYLVYAFFFWSYLVYALFYILFHFIYVRIRTVYTYVVKNNVGYPNLTLIMKGMGGQLIML